MRSAEHGQAAVWETAADRSGQPTAGTAAERPTLTPDLWSLIEYAAAQHPRAVALRDSAGGRGLSYEELLAAVEAQSADLAAAGVSAGDSIGVAVRRSARELITTLAALRLGAVFMPLEPSIPPAVAARMIDIARVRLVIGDAGRLASLDAALSGRKTLLAVGPAAVSRRRIPPAARPAGSEAAFISFTATGPSMAVRTTRASIVNLAYRPAFLRPSASDRFLRLAPLAHHRSLLELFVPLLAGGTSEVFPGGRVTPDRLAEFLHERAVTGLCLDSSVFRQATDYRPDAFSSAMQLLVTNGASVPAAQVRTVLSACPQLRLTICYGQPETSVAAAVHHVDGGDLTRDPLPIGRPVPGVGLTVRDGQGRPVPPDTEGEVYVDGAGVADGYADAADGSSRWHGTFIDSGDQVLYRTGDRARIDADGTVHPVGHARDERLAEINGLRVNLDHVADVLREHPAVSDAVVVPTVGDRLLVGLVAECNQALQEELRIFATERLQEEAVPGLWAFVGALPYTAEGKPDRERLTEVAAAADPVARAVRLVSSRRLKADQPRSAPTDMEQVITHAWKDVLKTEEFDRDTLFFEAGGTSVDVLALRASLRERLPGGDVTVRDIYRNPTIAQLVGHLEAMRTETGSRE